ncbi:MAG: ABC transporter permease [Anaerolineae bacterium]|nr:ABC transporter permease [Anaerolineae bacterium]
MSRLLDRLLFTLERLNQHRLLVLWALLGLAMATTLAMGVWQYVDAVNTRLLSSRLANPPYAFRFRYLGDWNGAITQADVESASAAINDGFAGTIDLPTALKVGFTRAGTWAVRREGDKPLPLGAMSLGTLVGAESQIEIAAGEWQPDPARKQGDPIPALIPEKLLYNMGLQVGDTLTATLVGAEPLTLRVAALWKPVNADDPAWIFPPKFFDSVILVQPRDLWSAVAGIARPVDEAAWYLSFEGATVKTSDVSNLLAKITDGQRNVTAALPGIRLDLSPVDNLNAFNAEVSRLTQQLVIMILPVSGLVLYFVSLIAGLLVARQQPEDVTLRSRGMARREVLGVHILMWLLLAGLALLIGVLLSPLLVRLVGQTSSFLHFDDLNNRLTVTLTPQSLLVGAVTSLIAISSALLIAWRSSGQTVTSFRQTSARAAKAWWQRLYLDVLLLIPAIYVLFTLNQQGGLITDAETPFSNPLAFLGPTVFSLGLTLLFLRLWPQLLRVGSSILNYGRGIAALMALRELARSIGRYRSTLLMMCFTLSLIGFTSSMASTVDRSLEDSINYKTGADAVLVTAVDAVTETASDASTTVTGFNEPPVADLLDVEGVAQVSRVGRYQGQIILPTQRLSGTVLGIDRGAMAAVTRFRSDYADTPIADLFNRLAGNRTGILISKAAAAQYKLLINQEIALQISALGSWYELRVPILGTLDYFPTLNPNDGFFVVMNIDPIFEAVGTPLPYDVWMSLRAGADPQAVEREVRALGFPVVRWLDPQQELEAARLNPSRQGVLGFLSIGFIASVLLTLISTVIQNTASFRAQSAQLGSLRAMGLSSGSVGAYLILVQGLVASSGILSGMGIGVATTLLFLPLLDFSGGLPPYQVRVDWISMITVYAALAIILFVVTLIMTVFMGRERLATIVKLGDV